MYAIADIGSNTMVLNLYTLNQGKPTVYEHFSTPAHLIDYVKDNKMSQEGIEKAKTILKNYDRITKEYSIKHCFACITEPCRIENKDDLIKALEETSFVIHPLSGEEEAYYDFIGAKLSYPDIEEGIAFDVGGGSTELIAFSHSTPTTAISFPLGCVRLSHLPLDTEACFAALVKERTQYPELNRECKNLIGIGGTVKAIGKMTKAIYETKDIIYTKDLEELYQKIIAKDLTALTVFQNKVDPDRQKLLLPGMHMVIEIARIYQAEKIYVSQNGVREGFLLECIKTI